MNGENFFEKKSFPNPLSKNFIPERMIYACYHNNTGLKVFGGCQSGGAFFQKRPKSVSAFTLFHFPLTEKEPVQGFSIEGNQRIEIARLFLKRRNRDKEHD